MIWNEFNKHAPRSAHDTIKIAVSAASKTGGKLALDIGAGNGRDSKFLKDSNYYVTAVDSCSESRKIFSRIEGIDFHCVDITEFDLKSYNLINASLVLPFIEHSYFNVLWRSLTNSLLPDGIICGHLFGTDDWKVRGNRAWGLKHDEICRLSEGFEVVSLKEFNENQENQQGHKVRKHNFSFVLKAA